MFFLSKTFAAFQLKQTSSETVTEIETPTRQDPNISVPSHSEPSPSCAILTLPPELLISIAQTCLLPTRRALSQTNRHIHSLLDPLCASTSGFTVIHLPLYALSNPPASLLDSLERREGILYGTAQERGEWDSSARKRHLDMLARAEGVYWTAEGECRGVNARRRIVKGLKREGVCYGTAEGGSGEWRREREGDIERLRAVERVVIEIRAELILARDGKERRLVEQQADLDFDGYYYDLKEDIEAMWDALTEGLKEMRLRVVVKAEARKQAGQPEEQDNIPSTPPSLISRLYSWRSTQPASPTTPSARFISFANLCDLDCYRPWSSAGKLSVADLLHRKFHDYAPACETIWFHSASPQRTLDQIDRSTLEQNDDRPGHSISIINCRGSNPGTHKFPVSLSARFTLLSRKERNITINVSKRNSSSNGAELSDTNDRHPYTPLSFKYDPILSPNPPYPPFLCHITTLHLSNLVLDSSLTRLLSTLRPPTRVLLRNLKLIHLVDDYRFFHPNPPTDLTLPSEDWVGVFISAAYAGGRIARLDVEGSLWEVWEGRFREVVLDKRTVGRWREWFREGVEEEFYWKYLRMGFKGGTRNHHGLEVLFGEVDDERARVCLKTECRYCVYRQPGGERG